MTNAYHDYGWNEGEPWSEHYLYPVIEEMLRTKQDRLILDLGCGNGSMAGRLIEQGFDVYGIDASESGISAANKRYPGRFFVQDIDSGNLPDELQGKEFDTVLSTEVIEHLYSPRDYMKMIASVLPRGGGSL